MDKRNLNDTVQSLHRCLTALKQQVGELPQTPQQSEQLIRTFEMLEEQIQELDGISKNAHPTEQAFRIAIENAVLPGITAVDLTGRQIYVNTTFCRMVGWEETELVGARLPFVYWNFDQQESTTQTFQAILNGDCSSAGVELSLQRRNGDRFQARLLASPISSVEGEQIAWVISVDDLTEHNQTVEALRQSEKRFQRLIANMPGMVYRYLPCAGKSDAFTYVNSGCHELFELDPQDVLRDAGAVWALVHPEDLSSLQASVAGAVEHYLPWQWEGRIITPSGQMKWIQGRSRPQRTTEGDVWDGLFIDITDRKQAEEQLQVSLREKEILLGEIHHRVKNNLQIVSSLLYLQASQLSDPQCNQILQNSRNRVESMAFVHESLYRSKNFAEFDFSEYLQDLVIRLFQTYNIRSSQVELNIEIEPGLILDLERALPCALIVNELMTNALRHGFCNSGRETIVVEAVATPAHQITMRVGNSGDTLPADFNLQAVQSMGLKLVSILVEQLEGILDFERGQNTIFRVTFQP